MKVTTLKPNFSPVVITLETQEEVDHLYALFNHAVCCPDKSPLGDAHEMFTEFYTDHTHTLWDELNKRIRATE